MARIMLVDDHPLVRAGVRAALSQMPDTEILAEAETGEQALSFARECEPELVIMDIRMPGMGGIAATERLVRVMPDVRVLGLSMCRAEPLPSRMLAAGAAGYLTKACTEDELRTAVARVAAGGHYVSPAIAANLALSLANRDRSGTAMDQLSSRELQVMQMVTQGMSMQQISERLHLSPKTVATYRYRLFEKLQVENDVTLTRLAMRYGLLNLDEEESIALG